MNGTKMKLLALVLMMTVTSLQSIAQLNDSPLVRKSTIKYHIVSFAVYTKSLVFSYERITKPNQSFAIMAGYVQFPEFPNKNAIIKVDGNKVKNGLTLGGEYRFYLQKENKYPAPHGVFIGPYANFYSFGNDRVLSINSSDGSTTAQAFLKSDLSVLNVGFQLGYQFVFNDRWTVDLVFIGPSVSRYALKMKLDGSYDIDDEDIIKDEILLAILDRFPLIKDLLDDKEVDLQGRTAKLAPGFRYQVNVGYRFGKANHKK